MLHCKNSVIRRPRTVKILAGFILMLLSITLVSAATSSYIFEDGFEAGGFGAWTGISTSSGERAYTTTSLSYEGVRCARFSSSGGGGYERAYSYRSLASYQSELYTRGYFRVSQSGIAQNNDRFYFMRLRSGSNDLASVGWRMVNGMLRWCLIVRSGTSYATAYSNSAPSLNVWYCVELHWKGASSGLGELWVNGVKVASVSNVNTAALGNANSVRFGLAEVYGCAATSINADNFVISTKYVGLQQTTTPTPTPIPTPAPTPTAMPTPTSTPTPNPAPSPTPTPTPGVGVKVAVFSDSACTKSLSSIEWGTVSRGVSVTKVVYVKNVGSSQVTLSLMKTNWNPAAANGPVTVNWNREGATLAANKVLSATLTLSVSSSVTGFTTFSVDAVITGTG